MARFPPPGRLVDIGGMRLHLLCTGQGAPTVVMDAPLGSCSLGWSLVQPGTSRFTRTCSFDRAGYGWSDPGPSPRTSGRIVDELYRALVAAGERGPFVLVGASVGGCNMRLFAARYPDDAAALVLVDSAHEDQLERMPAAAPSAAEMRTLTMFRIASRLGLLRLRGMPVGEASMGFLPPLLQAEAEAVGYRSTVVDAVFGETVAISASFEELRQALSGLPRPHLGDRPLVVITHEEASPPSGEEAALYRTWLELQSDLVAESSRGRQVIAKPSGHFIAVDRPVVVIDAIQDVVSRVRVASGSTESGPGAALRPTDVRSSGQPEQRDETGRPDSRMHDPG